MKEKIEVPKQVLIDVIQALSGINEQLASIRPMYPRDDTIMHLNIGRLEAMTKGLEWVIGSNTEQEAMPVFGFRPPQTVTTSEEEQQEEEFDKKNSE